METEEKKEQTKLPALSKKISEELAKQNKVEAEYLVKLQGFMKLLNAPVEKDKLQKHPYSPSHYLPISFMEMTLDEIYFGLWQTVEFKWQQVANELIGSIELEVFHPFHKQWMKRTGAAAHQIMVDAVPENMKKGMTNRDKNQWSLDPGNKKPSALSNGGFAALKAECFRNACLSLGKKLGRDVNRKHTDIYDPLIKTQDQKIQPLRTIISKFMEHFQDEEVKQEIIDKILEAEDKGENTWKFYQDIIIEHKMNESNSNPKT